MIEIIRRFTGPLDVTLALGALSYTTVYLACKVAVEVYGFANPKLAMERYINAQNAELAEIARQQIQAQVDHTVSLFEKEFGEGYGR